ncbi:MAG: hypothetical protein JST79_04990 [Acidobacteria bacterium]|nr:hypothetical protein [Acidobacteriota bacterium]
MKTPDSENWARSGAGRALSEVEVSSKQSAAMALADILPAVSVPDDCSSLESLGRTVASVAHDFNNLITGILLYSDLMLVELPAQSRLRRHAQEIRQAGQQGCALIQQLFLLARRQPSEAQWFSWNEHIGQARHLLACLAGEKVRLVTRLARQLDSVPMGPSQMQQILVNLVLNARDAMPQGGEIVIATRNGPRPQQVELTVSDSGCGMSAHTQAHLFQLFYTTKPPGRGNGLGLCTVQDYVRRAGGQVTVKSTPGKGTRVAMVLPAAGCPGAERAIHFHEVSQHERHPSNGHGPYSPDRRRQLPQSADRRRRARGA